MTKIFCDRCKKEIKHENNKNIVSSLKGEPLESSIKTLCSDCFSEFCGFMSGFIVEEEKKLPF